MYRNLESV